VALRTGHHTVRNLCDGVRPTETERMPVTDTPIYDQMQWERSGEHSRSEQPSRRSATATPHGQESARRTVSVWALVDEHRRRS
jgi:hypothetical protein